MKIKNNDVSFDLKTEKLNEANKVALKSDEKNNNESSVKKTYVSTDSVSISSEALKKLEEESKIEFNSKKVNDLKLKIESGNYEFNYEQISKKLIDFEK